MFCLSSCSFFLCVSVTSSVSAHRFVYCSLLFPEHKHAADPWDVCHYLSSSATHLVQVLFCSGPDNLQPSCSSYRSLHDCPPALCVLLCVCVFMLLSGCAGLPCRTGNRLEITQQHLVICLVSSDLWIRFRKVFVSEPLLD